MAPCLDVLRKLSATERDLIRLVVEIVQELRDSDDNEDVAAGACVSAGS
jgi:condensin complex subunit 3